MGGVKMRRKGNPKQRDKYYRAIFLFGQRCSPEQVAYKLDIPIKKAKQIHLFFLCSQKIDEETERNITDDYKEKLEHEEVVDRIIKNVKEERKKDLDFERISKDSGLFTEFLSESGHQVMEIFFYDSFGKCIGCWTKDKWERSPFWINFESRFYSRAYSCFCYN